MTPTFAAVTRPDRAAARIGRTPGVYRAAGGRRRGDGDVGAGAPTADLLATNLLVAIGWASLAVGLVGINRPPSDPVVIDWPLAGEWYWPTVVEATLSTPTVSAHFRSSESEQTDALDVVQLQNGRSLLGDPKQLTSYVSLGQPVLAPGDGIVTAVAATLPDLPIGTTDNKNLEGNYVVLDLGRQRHVMFAHLKRGSARAAVGDRVERGQPIAQVGNSGSTSEPHLHLQVQNQPTSGPSTQGLRTYPMLLREVELVRGREGSRPMLADPRRDNRIRRIND